MLNSEIAMRVIGTAGHVDHGKSALVLALTGTDPDRLAEEKARGMTIELGFALLRLPSGDETGVIDVPGHERFVKTMLAGVGGIDLALLVVAANDGVKPQTREHLAIIDLLGIRHGVVALTKSDTVREVERQSVAESVAGLLAGTALAGSLIVACSAKTGAGLDELVEAIVAQLALTPERPDLGRPRLPIDRAFTMAGFGTVVTGTLTGGSLNVGQEAEVAPGGMRARIRGLQNHGRAIETARPGQRTAINLTGVAVEDLRRGMVVAAPGVATAATVFEVHLRAVPYLERGVRHNSGVTFHTGAAEASGRLLLLDADSISAGESAWAQVRLAEPVAAMAGDRFVVRDANGTVGGGTIVAADAPRRRRHHLPTISALEARLRPARLGGMIEAIGAACAVAHTVEEELAAYHAAYPVRPGMARVALKSRTGASSRAFDALIKAIISSGVVRAVGNELSLTRHTPTLSGADRAVAEEYLATLRASRYAPPIDGRPSPELIEYLLDRGEIVRAGDVIFDGDAYTEMADGVAEHLRANGSITLAEVRDMFGTSRRYAQAVLERMDAERVTKRAGEARVLR